MLLLVIWFACSVGEVFSKCMCTCMVRPLCCFGFLDFVLFASADKFISNYHHPQTHQMMFIWHFRRFVCNFSMCICICIIAYLNRSFSVISHSLPSAFILVHFFSASRYTSTVHYPYPFYILIGLSAHYNMRRRYCKLCSFESYTNCSLEQSNISTGTYEIDPFFQSFIWFIHRLW